CKSGQCGNDGTNGYCVEMCDPANDGCPSGFGCLVAGTTGVCWPGADGGGGGGCNSGNESGGAALMVFSLGALLITRRRRFR
ncbi:MAG: MYXO-CTERM sorting domain-containing protein, partial [Polyangiales bacterium]